MDLSIKWELILPTLLLPQPDLAKVGREFLVAHGAGQTAWLLKLLFAVMGLGFEKWESTFN